MSGCGGVDALLSYTKSACCEINVAERGPVLHAWPCCGAKPILLYIVIFLISTGPVCTGPTSEPWNNKKWLKPPAQLTDVSQTVV